MIIFSGWGAVLGFLTLLPASLTFAIPEEYERLRLILMALALVGAGAVSFFVGRYLNVRKPSEKREAAWNAHRQMIQDSVNNGTFHLGPGNPAPRDRAEAQAQAEWLLANQWAELHKKKPGSPHTFFFIPVQWWGLSYMIGGLVLLVVALVTAVI